MSNIQVVQVSFDQRDLSRRYSYFLESDEKPYVGQPAVVYAGGEYKVVTIAKVDDIPEEDRARASAWIVQLINPEEHLARVKARREELGL